MFAERHHRDVADVLWIGAGQTSAAYLLPKYVECFRKRWPEVGIEIRTGTGKQRLRVRNCALGEGMALLRAGEVEFVLGAREPLEDYGLEYCEMLSYDIVLITSLAQTSSTTPLLLQQRRSAGYFAYPSHDLLSQAVDVLRVRPILLQRHGGQAERALANVDLYLSFSRAYAVRGLRAFADAMTAAWTDESRAVEGRPDAQKQSVALYTMHAAKGLEWPIVVPVNTMSRLRAPEKTVIDRETGRLYFPVFGVAPTGHEAAFENEQAELDRERIRLWYVAATRAGELFILPRLDVPPTRTAWIALVDFSLAEVPGLDIRHHPLEFAAGAVGIENTQTRERFVLEAAAVAERRRRITWLAPSRDEGADVPVLGAQMPQIVATDAEAAQAEAGDAYTIRGGRERGVILHKLIEEVLTGETQETLPGLVARAESLIRVLGQTVADDPVQGLVPAELAECVIRTLSLSEIADLRPRLVPEVPVYSAVTAGAEEHVTTGVADAVALGPVDAKEHVYPVPTASFVPADCSYVGSAMRFDGPVGTADYASSIGSRMMIWAEATIWSIK